MDDMNSVELKLFRNWVPFSNISSIQIDCFHMWKAYKTVCSIVNATSFLRGPRKAMKRSKLAAKAHKYLALVYHSECGFWLQFFVFLQFLHVRYFWFHTVFNIQRTCKGNCYFLLRHSKKSTALRAPRQTHNFSIDWKSKRLLQF